MKFLSMAKKKKEQIGNYLMYFIKYNVKMNECNDL